MTKKQKNILVRIIISAILFALLLILEHTGTLDLLPYPWLSLIFSLIPYLIIGYDILLKAFKNIRNGQVFDENFLMTIATFGAFGVGEYTEAIAVMLFYQIGELFQSYAVGKSRKSISDMMDICPEYANIEQDGDLIQVDPDDVEIGTIIVVKPGERIPLDGIVVEGSSLLDTAALTGEFVPRKCSVGDNIYSGCVNGEGILKIEVTKEFDDSTVAKILELVENASSKKAKVENFITKFARFYTPIVTICALLLAVIPPLFTGYNWLEWLQRACIFLVISCPCALVISVPLGFFSGIGLASRAGILIKGSNYLELIASLDTIVFDKTGTLTKGEFKVSEILTSPGVSQDTLIEIAALAECYSNHPIAASLREAYNQSIDTSRVGDTKEIAGHGISTTVDQNNILIGNEKLMLSHSIDFQKISTEGTIVHVAQDKQYLGAIVISDAIKETSQFALSAIKKAGVKQTVMLTGDRKDTALFVANKLGIDKVFYELLPEDKVEKLEMLLSNNKGKNYVAFVGDGINDAPVLTRADIGFAMGSMGSDAAIEAADVVIMDDDITKIATSVKIARKTLRIVKENIVFALSIKLIVLLLGAFGIANMWEAVFADVGVSVIAIVNSMRIFNTRLSVHN